MNANAHPLINAYVARHRLPPETLRADGRATLVVDDRWRVHLQRGDAGWMAITARLCALPPAGIARDDFLLHVGRMAGGMASKYASTCSIDPKEEGMWLQQSVRPDSHDIEVDEALAEFLNALSFWTSAVRRTS